MSNIHLIDNTPLTVKKIREVVNSHKQLELSAGAKEAILGCRRYLEERFTGDNHDVVYGINTGFGSLCNVQVEKQDLEQLQHNLVMSHACGAGDLVPEKIVRVMMLLKIQSLAQGHSGVTLELVNRLVDFYNLNIIPVVYTQGSLGASGDLAPLAHLSLPIIGLGEYYEDGVRTDAEKIEAKYGLTPLKLKAKEGLALLNGTQFMGAYGVVALLKSMDLSLKADLISALSFEAYDCRLDPLDALIHQVRPHPGQIATATNLRNLLSESALARQEKQAVQDPYSFRCIPQVHGATKDVISHAREVILREINSVTDNPNIFPDEDKILSGGNFHGQPLALIFDYLAIGMAELGNISERRTFKLNMGHRGLPPFLMEKAGLDSGFMITQYTAASIVSENKQLCTPSSVDSIVSSNGQEDHVSMGANGAVKLLKVVENLEKILAIELINATQGVQFRDWERTSPVLKGLINKIREKVPFIKADVVMYKEMRKTEGILREINPEDYLGHVLS